MNTELLLKIKESILENPLRFDMTRWVNTNDTLASCGTTACLAGWAVMLNEIKGELTKEAWVKTGKALDIAGDNDSIITYTATHVQQRAKELLGLETNTADKLFYTKYWPSPFKENYAVTDWELKNLEWEARAENDFGAARHELEAKRMKLARITADRIDHFIQHEP